MLDKYAELNYNISKLNRAVIYHRVNGSTAFKNNRRYGAFALQDCFWTLFYFAERRIFMELVVKHFSELSLEELVDIYKLRVSVFVVEQKCPYQEIDDADKKAYHLYLKDDNGIQAYARVLPQGTTFDEASLGRVIARKRRCGLGSQIVAAAIECFLYLKSIPKHS